MRFLSWYIEQHTKEPTLSVAEAKHRFEDIHLNNRIRWMSERGYSEDTIRALHSEKALFLGTQELIDALKSNTALPLKYMDKDDVLVFLVEYRAAFSMTPAVFGRYIADIIEHVGEEWQGALLRQYQEDREHMIFRNMPLMPMCTRQQWKNELERLYYCSRGLFYIEA